MEERAAALALAFHLAPRQRRRSRSVLPRFDGNVRLLREAYRVLTADVRAGRFVTAAAEWLLDNFHVIANEIQEIRRNLPRGYYRGLPQLASGGYAGEARIYALAVELIRHSDSRLEPHQLRRFLHSFQRASPLSIGELWAWPSMLKLALIENLRRLAEETLQARGAREAADAYVTAFAAAVPPRSQDRPLPSDAAALVQLLLRVREYGLGMASIRIAIEEYLGARQSTAEDAIRQEHQRQGAAQVSVANAINSLRMCATLDWQEYVEAVSLVEQVLRSDPAAAYAGMDFLSRDRQRQAVEEIAAARPGATGATQIEVALLAVELARQAAAQTPTDRRAHVGYYLVDNGRPGLEAALHYRPRPGQRLRRAVLARPAGWYLGAIGLATAAPVAAAAACAWRWKAPASALLALVLLLAIPASDFAIACINRLAAGLTPPRRLPRLDFSAGVPPAARTMVVVPTMLTSGPGVDALLEHLEVLALGNLETCIHFAILGDFADAGACSMPGDEAILARAQEGVAELNHRYSPDRGDRFYFFHRDRQWNPGERVWMGWERKRGKIEEFNRLLRGARDTSFSTQLGALDVLPSIRYCITLDSDTRLPRDVARKLIGMIAHPLNRPVLDRRLGRVTAGYGILQPRVSVTMASAAGSLFARAYAGHTGVDPYTTAVSDVYQDVFGEGIYTGKGLYDVDAFVEALAGRVPDNALLSHDLFEGLYARAALVSDLEVVDDYPSNVLAHGRRQHRWVRGDWQILCWLLPWVPARAGWQRNRLPLISRWKILDNLRRSLLAPALVAWLLFAWTVLPGRPWIWTAAGLAALAFPLLAGLAGLLRGPGRDQSWPAFLRAAGGDLQAAAARWGLQVVFLANEAWQRLHAIAVTLVRLAITRRNLLEWETTAASAVRGRKLRWEGFFLGMRASPIVALAGSLLVAQVHPGALRTAAPVLLAWALAPWVALVLSRPVVPRRSVLTAADREFLTGLARRTWNYFETFAGSDNHGVPADNMQAPPNPVEAAWRRHEQRGRPLPAIEARPQATKGSDQAKSGGHLARRSPPWRRTTSDSFPPRRCWPEPLPRWTLWTRWNAGTGIC